MLREARRQLLSVLKGAGLFRVAANSRWRSARLLILCYHGVSIDDEHEWNNELYMSPDSVRERFETLRQGRYSVLPLAEALERLRAGTLPPRASAITFDDGGYDFYVRAFPLLQEYGYPATVYLTTYYSEHQMPVFDTGCAYVLWRARRRSTPVDLSAILPGIGPMWIDTDRGRRGAALRIREQVNAGGLSGEEKDMLLRQVAVAVGFDYDEIFSRRLLFVMTPEEVRKVAAAGMDIQLHTHRHRTPDDPIAFAREIEDNRASIAAMLGPGVRSHFCYPSGVHNAKFFEWLARAGVESATTCDVGLAAGSDNRLLLPRLVDTMNISSVEFEARLCGVAEWLPQRRLASRVSTRPVAMPGAANGGHAATARR